MAIGKLKSLGQFDAGAATTGTAVQLDPVPGPGTIVAVESVGAWDSSVQVEGSHDLVSWVPVNAAITGGGGFDLIAPWPHLRVSSAGGGTATHKLDLTIFYVFDD